MVFGALYAVVLFGVAAARAHFSDQGLYVVAALSGLTDMDAITLSAAHMIDMNRLDLDRGCRMILVGALSNLVFKGGIVFFLADRTLSRRVMAAFGLSILGGLLLLIFWPKMV